MTEIEKYQSLDPTRFDILDKFEVYQHYSNDEDHVVLIELRLRMFENEEDDDYQRLVLSFSGVRDLKVHFQGFMLLPVVHIRSIRQYQWEKLNYEVKDAENQSFLSYVRVLKLRWKKFLWSIRITPISLIE